MWTNKYDWSPHPRTRRRLVGLRNVRGLTTTQEAQVLRFLDLPAFFGHFQQQVNFLGVMHFPDRSMMSHLLDPDQPNSVARQSMLLVVQ